MKRKLALLLAAVMTLTQLPMNVFAATSNSVTRSTTVVPEKTLLHEDGMGGAGLFNVKYDSNGNNIGYVNGDIQYTLEGGYLVMTVSDSVRAGDEVRLKLENAKWFFRSISDTASGTYGKSLITLPASASVPKLASDLTSSPAALAISAPSGKVTVSEAGYDNGTIIDATLVSNATYDGTKGVWYANKKDSSEGTYYRFANTYANNGSTNVIKEVPYSLTVSSLTDKEAVLRILASYDVDPANTVNAKEITEYTGNAYQIRVPLVSLTTEANADIKVKITDSNTSSISNNEIGYRYGIAGDSLTNTYLDDPQSARDEFKLNKIIIKETRLNSIKAGTFYITAPSGFYFGNLPIDGGKDPAYVGVETGLAWDSTRTGKGDIGRAIDGKDYSLDYRRDNGKADETVVEVTLHHLVKSTTISGAVYINDLMLYPDDDSNYWGDITLSIKNLTSSDKVLTNQTFKAGTRVDWTISLKTEGTIPELVNGRYKKHDLEQAEDDIHQTARVIFSENSVAAWWADRETIFLLPEGVKFRKVDVIKVENMINKEGKDANSDIERLYVGDGRKYTIPNSGSIVVSGNKMTWKTFKVKAKEKAKIKMDIWVSIESGFVGDVTLTVTSNVNAIPDQPGLVTPITIAKQITPVTVSTKITDIKIGYQLQPTADIVIKETKAGNLLKDKTVKVSITDFVGGGSYGASDIAFSPDTKVSVDTATSNMKIKNIGISTNTAASDSALSTTGGTLKFDIDTVSTKPATITISNASIKIDRTVPETNDRAYKVVVWGTAIAENYNNTSTAPKDTFATPGVMADYMKVISSANDKSSILTQRVEVAIGETTYTVNGNTFEMDAAAYISPASNSTLVPVRFIANAFGIDDNQVLWDDSSKSVTIIHQDRTVQFTGNSDKMLINGAVVTNYSPDGLKVVAEITGDRMYVPFRALGDAFGVKVAWDNATQTAIYNPDAVVGQITTTDAKPAAEANK
jgi:hypothetical protein